jgi:hypothetical protein
VTRVTAAPATGAISDIQGPKYTAVDSWYRVTLGSKHIQLSADGGLLALEGIERFNGLYLTDKIVGDGDPKGGYSRPWVSPTGSKVAFTTYYNWTTDLYAADFGTNPTGPRRVETAQVARLPHSRRPASTWWPVASGEPDKLEHRDVFTGPFL